MKKALWLLASVALLSVGAVQAQAFVWPQAWTTAKPGEVKRGGTLKSSTISDYRTFNPFTTAEAGNVPSLMAGRAGFATRSPSTGDWVPYMAESWTISANKLDFTFKIRKGMKFSDGEPITADDWITTWKIITDKAVGSNARDGFFIDGQPIVLKKIDDYTVKVSLPKTDATALGQASFTPWPDHIFGKAYREGGAEAIKKMWQLNANPADIVSPGPWVLETYRPGERVVLKRNPFFGEWNKDEAGNALPYLDRYEFLIVKDTNAQLAAFMNGDIDIYAPSTVDQISQIRKAVADKKLDATLKVNASPIASSQFMVFNWNKKSDPFKEKLFRSAKFRQAMSHIVNRQAVVDVVYGGLATPTYTSVYPVLTQWVNPKVAKFEYDL
ncbi:MAG: ABC transporter substrate-binding protein, partial [Deinococcus sp.]|nr:ABC transporter substrate-binding protein [Deinococcus sp.]